MCFVEQRVDLGVTMSVLTPVEHTHYCLLNGCITVAGHVKHTILSHMPRTIWSNPTHLFNLVVKATYEAFKTVLKIVLICLL